MRMEPTYFDTSAAQVRGLRSSSGMNDGEYRHPAPLPQSRVSNAGGGGYDVPPPGFPTRASAAPLAEQLRRAVQQDQAAGEAEQELLQRLGELQHRRRGLKAAIEAAEAELKRQQTLAAAPNDGVLVGAATWRHAPAQAVAREVLQRDSAASALSTQATFIGSVPQTSAPLPVPSSNVGARGSLLRAPRAQFISVGRPVGLPNRRCDCFWLSAVQCMRHTPGFARAMSSAAPVDADDRPSTLHQALSKLLLAMEMSEPEGQLQPDCQALEQFRFFANQALPASDGTEKLVQVHGAAQRQQDVHEFLTQLVDHLGGAHPDVEQASPRIHADKQRLEALEKELTSAARVNSENPQSEAKDWARKTAYNLLYEYSMIQWSSSATRIKSRAIGSIFEGQRLASISCRSCGRFSASGAEPFVIEEVRLADATEDAGWLGSLGGLFGGGGKAEKVSLADLLRKSAENPAPEGYICPNSFCKQVGTSARKGRLFRLPATLVLHINRAQSDGSRCEMVLDFETTLDLNNLGMVVHFGKPLDRALEPCSTEYSLFGAVFHRGPNARSGHYFAYVLYGGAWVRVDDNRVAQPLNASKATPMALEASEPAEGARVALLFYQRKG